VIFWKTWLRMKRCTRNREGSPVSSRAEALLKAIHRYYAVIISDINMTGFPTPDAVNLCRRRNIPLVR